MTSPTAAPAPAPATAAGPRLPALSYFFPAHNEADNLAGLVEEALATLPTLAEEFEIVIVDDGSKDATPALADELAAAHPEVRAVHHPVNLGYGAALRSGFAAARFDHLAFTDGDRQFKVADLGRLIERLQAGSADAVVGYRIQRADPLVRTVYARLYRLANRIFFGLKVKDVDCACKLFRRAALEGLAVESGGAFFSAELLIKLRARRPADRRGGRSALPAHRRQPHRREATGRPPGGPRLLGAAPPPVGRAAQGPRPRHADPGRPQGAVTGSTRPTPSLCTARGALFLARFPPQWSKARSGAKSHAGTWEARLF